MRAEASSSSKLAVLDAEGPVAEFAQPYLPELDGKEVEAVCTGYEVKQSIGFGKPKIYLTLRLLGPGVHANEQLTCAMNYGTKNGPRSKYFTAWCIANEGLPARKDRMSPRRFLDSVFVCRCHTVRRDYRGRDRHPSTHYTVVEEIVDLAVRGKRSRP